jgi:hypothetical protein
MQYGQTRGMEVVMNMEADPVISGVSWKFPIQLPGVVSLTLCYGWILCEVVIPLFVGSRGHL